MTTDELSPETARAFVTLAVDNVRREFPNAPQHTLTDPGESTRPRELHPAFYGSYDWHSCVHMHWLLARLLRRFPDLPAAPAARSVLAEHLTAANLATEAAYIDGHPTFERPYGWGWTLRLAHELAGWDDPLGRDAAAAMRPLADAVTDRFLRWLPAATYPVRHGVHSNSAFGLVLALGYARAAGRDDLVAAVTEAAVRWFADDSDYPGGWEPSGEDFLSPALVEAELMRLVLDGPRYAEWLGRFLPGLPDGEPAALFAPAVVSDRSDYRIVHLDGLNLSRAWCWRLMAGSLDDADPRRTRALRAAHDHLAASLPHVASGEYGGDHWLASFALLALSG